MGCGKLFVVKFQNHGYKDMYYYLKHIDTYDSYTWPNPVYMKSDPTDRDRLDYLYYKGDYIFPKSIDIMDAGNVSDHFGLLTEFYLAVFYRMCNRYTHMLPVTMLPNLGIL